MKSSVMREKTRLKPIRVCHVSHKAERYGIGTFLLALIEEQRKHTSSLLVSVAFQTSGEREGAFEALGIPIHNVRTGSARSPRLGWRLWRIFRAYDVIHLHTLSPWAFLAARLRGKRIVTTFHGSCGLRGGWADNFRRWFIRYVAHNWCDRIVFVSQIAKARFEKRFQIDLPSNSCTEIANGLNIRTLIEKIPSPHFRNQSGWSRKFVIGCAARLDPQKCLERLIETQSMLSNEEYLTVIAGSGDIQYEQYLRSLVKQQGLQKEVHFLGFRSDIYDVISNLDLFVMTSINEPFGLSLLEAMALGIPCVAFSDSGAPIEILGSKGCVVNTSTELASVIKELKFDKLLYKKMKNDARERAQVFSNEIMAQKYNLIYKSIS